MTKRMAKLWLARLRSWCIKLGLLPWRELPMISQEAWDAWLLVGAVFLVAAAALFAAYMKAKAIDRRPDDPRD
jgi:hypothetical protein